MDISALNSGIKVEHRKSKKECYIWVMNNERILISSILAGVMISISSIAYLNTIPVVGSFIFAVGLLSILHFKLDLFTGKVPLNSLSVTILSIDDYLLQAYLRP